ncbi:MAG TPA: Gfo/Idh/MocA family oxidoreductase, partial [Roseimicrobium sp.]|nr:Gfo/Idh/MocA family oxidoreductase [Roseimicrobium sp.]
MTSIGIIGLGFMAATHIKAIRELPNARLGALCNPSGRHLDGDFSNVAGNLGNDEPVRVDMTATKAYRNVDELLADPDIQLIDICAPTHTHLNLAVAALRAGKHVLCEKPLARTSAEARLIADAAAEATSFFMPAMCVRFAPSWAMVKILIENQTYGKALSARFRRVAQPPGWGHQHFKDGKKSGGALLDL